MGIIPGALITVTTLLMRRPLLWLLLGTILLLLLIGVVLVRQLLLLSKQLIGIVTGMYNRRGHICDEHHESVAEGD